jgi:phage terminase large subunit
MGRYPKQDEQPSALDPEIISRWALDPLTWVIECEGIVPTKQQRAYWTELGKIVRAKFNLGAGYFDEFIKSPANIAPEHRATMDEEYQYARKIGISVMSGKGTGKTAVAAQTVRWFMRFFTRARVAITGPSYDQVRDCLWRELIKWNNRRDDQGTTVSMISDYFDIKADQITLKTEQGRPEKETAYARIRTAPANANKEAQQETLSGWHEDNMLIMIDEASKVPEPVFKAFDSTLTRPLNLVVMIFNPTRNSGYAYETHYGKRKANWITLQWDSRESEIVSPEFVETYRQEYGERSIEFQMFIKGLPPEDTTDAVIPYSKITDAVGRELFTEDDEPFIAGLDPAREGTDKAGMILRQGSKIVDVQEWAGLRTEELAQAVINQLEDYRDKYDTDIAGLYIETTGIGAGVYDILKRMFPRTYGVDVNTKPRLQRYGRLRDELWYTLRDRFVNDSISIPEHAHLKSELGVMKFKQNDPKGRIKIENKQDLKVRGVKSPNLADALMITMHANDRALRQVQRNLNRFSGRAQRRRDIYDERDDRPGRSARRTSRPAGQVSYAWMRA